MATAATAKSNLSVRELPPNIFAVVMATGIVSLAANGAGQRILAISLFWLNFSIFILLWLLLVLRVTQYRDRLVEDLKNHAKAPGFFTLVAAPCVLGSQSVLLFAAAGTGLFLWVMGMTFWVGLSYVMLPALMEGAEKP